MFEVEKLRVLDDALLEAKEIAAAGVGFRGRRLAQQSAKVVEMPLVGGGFLALVAGPFLFEFRPSCAVVFVARDDLLEPCGEFREILPARHGPVLPEARRYQQC